MYYSFWRYLMLRMSFLNWCRSVNQHHQERYKRPVRTTFCTEHRALIARYGNQWEMKEIVYVSSFCDRKKCDFDGTCAECTHDFMRYVIK